MFAKIHEYCQDNSIWYDDFVNDEYYENTFCVYGNRDYIDRTTDIFKSLIKILSSDDIQYELEKLENETSEYNTVEEIINDYMYFCDINRKFDHKQALEIVYYIGLYDKGSREEQNALAGLLTMITGKQWDYCLISGCCQSEWNYLYYDCTVWNEETIKQFETLYYNLGYEMEISDNEEMSNSYWSYGYEWNEEKRLQEIAENANCTVDELVILED